MPVMAYLGMENARALTRNDFVRLGLVTGAGEDALPYSAHYVADFEKRYCYDRYLDRGRRRQRRPQHALPLLRPWPVGGRQRGLAVLHEHRHRRARAVSPSALPAVHDRALPEGVPADGVGSAGARARTSRGRQSQFGEAFQTRDPPALRDLPALHPPLLVPRHLGTGARRRRCSRCAPITSASIRCTPR